MNTSTNLEAAQLCLQRARDCLGSGKHEDARRFCHKAMRMCSEGDIEAFARAILLSIPAATPSPSSRSSGSRGSKGDGDCSAESETKREDHPDSIVAIKTVLHKDNYYEILGVEKTAESGEIKKKYRKLALLLHPDRCRHPKAEDAFKKVQEAFATLSDGQKRAEYDEGPRRRRRVVYDEFHNHGFNNVYGMDDMDIFEFIRRRERQARFRRQHPNENFSFLNVWFQILPPLLLVGVGLLSVFLGRTNEHGPTEFSFVQDEYHNHLVCLHGKTHAYVNEEHYKALDYRQRRNLLSSVRSEYKRHKEKCEYHERWKRHVLVKLEHRYHPHAVPLDVLERLDEQEFGPSCILLEQMEESGIVCR